MVCLIGFSLIYSATHLKLPPLSLDSYLAISCNTESLAKQEAHVCFNDKEENQRDVVNSVIYNVISDRQLKLTEA